jgi:hypothetical protein
MEKIAKLIRSFQNKRKLNFLKIDNQMSEINENYSVIPEELDEIDRELEGGGRARYQASLVTAL